MKKLSTFTKSDLDQFTGDDIRFRTINPSVINSLGVQHVAQHGHAYWLIDAIASYFVGSKMRSAMKKDYRIQSLQFWRLEVKNDAAKLTACADSDVQPFITQKIEYTDFPLSSIDIWAGYDGQLWTLYLPSEH